MSERDESATSDEALDAHEALTRLAASDPVAGVSADSDALWVATQERLWEGRGTDEVMQRREQRARRRTPGVLVGVAAAACAVALAAGVGFTAGRGNGGAQPVALPAFTLGQGSAGANGAESAAPAMGGPQAMGGARAADAKMMPAYFGGHTVFTAGDGLSTDGGSATGYGYDARAVDGRAAAAKAAKVLGVSGTPVYSGGTWTVGPNDGSGASVSVSIDGLRTFYAYDPTVDPYACPKPMPEPVPAESSAPDGSTSSNSGAAMACPSGEPKAAPGSDEAIATAKRLMGSLGAEAGAFEWQVDTSSPGVAYVTALQMVNGQQTGAAWWFSVTHGGRFSNVSGFLAPVLPQGDYPVVSPREVVDRLNSPAFGGFFGGPMPQFAQMRGGVAAAAPQAGVAADGSATSDTEPTMIAPTEPPALPEPGAKVSWPVSRVTITACTLGLAQFYQPSGATTLVPTYQCEAGKGQGTYTVIAGADSALDTSVPTP